MIPNDQPERSTMIKYMLDGLRYIDLDKMNSWEHDFYYSVNEQFQHKGDLSNKQCEILERIYDK